MRLASTQALYAYWNALRGARSAPERNDIEPGAIRGVLADTFVLELAQKGGFPFRIVGSRTNALFGRELRGEGFLPLWDAGDRDEIAALLVSAADDAQPFLIGARGAPDAGAALDVEVLILPLRHHGATHARLLGCCAPVANPSWVGYLPMRPLKINSLRALAIPPGDGLAQKRPMHPDAKRRGHLFVYSSRS